MVKITNTINPGCARGVETPTGTVYIEPGETAEVELLDPDRPLYEGLEIADESGSAELADEPGETADEEPDSKPAKGKAK